MKFELGNNDCEPCVVVTKKDGELVVMFEGFGYEEAQKWFNSKDVMSSLESWHFMTGDYEMAYKQIKWREIEMSEREKKMNDILNHEENLKICPPARESDLVSYFTVGYDIFSVSHPNGEVIFDEDIFKKGEIDCLGTNMTMDEFVTAMLDEGLNAYVKHWCEKEHCTSVFISRVHPGTLSPAKVERIRP